MLTGFSSRIIPVLLLLAMLMIACGSDDDDDDAGDVHGDDDGAQGEDRIAAYIRGDAYPKLILEVDNASDQGPRQAVLEELADGLPLILDKPEGVESVTDEELDDRPDVWTLDDLKGLAKDTFNLPTDEETIKIHLLYVDGTYDSGEEGGTILGLAWNNTHVAIFIETIQDVCSDYAILNIPKERMCAKAELFVLSHEIGHIIGLVDLGLPMVEDHEDAGHEHHDVNDECLMYWAYEGESLLGLIRDRLLAGDESNLGFCEKCQADIEAIRDK